MNSSSKNKNKKRDGTSSAKQKAKIQVLDPEKEAKSMLENRTINVRLYQETELKEVGSDELKLIRRFMRYLKWLRDPKTRSFRYVKPRSVTTALQVTRDTLIGVQLLTQTMETDMKLFSSKDYDVPHGLYYKFEED